MTINGVGGFAEEAAEAGVQWLLQPRGNGRDGREHFQHTVVEGVALADYEDVLGDAAPRLAECFPGDAVARFWGATPAAHDWHPKAKAIRDSEVGDEVLFYNSWKFIARATIVHKFRNERLAARLWGTDEESGATWQHMIALGDVVQFEAEARPLLDSINVSGALRGLTLVSAEKRLAYIRERGMPWSPRTSLGGFPSPRNPTTGPAPSLGERELLNAFTALRTHTRPDGPSLHKPLALLWSLGRLTEGKARLAPWSDFEREVGGLLSEFGGTGSRATPHYPFWRLRGDIWEVEGVPGDVSDPGPEALRRADAKGGFVDDAARLLRKARVRAKAVRALSSTYFDADTMPLVLEQVGLSGYLNASGHTTSEATDTSADDTETPSGPVERRTVVSARPTRNPKLVKNVKQWHRSICQVCSTPLEGLLGPFSEAAHIQGLGTPHEGPDHTSNMLCLCPNHHTQFDGLAIYIDAQWNVRRTTDDEVLFELRLDPQHRIAQEHVAYHRLLCGKDD
ncbi:HNH endonuclease [Streptomyces sp. NPDC055055]